MQALLLALVLLLVSQVAFAGSLPPVTPPDPDSCPPAISAAERQFRLPAKLLDTIAIVESGRADPATGRTTPWPWTINAGGTGRFFDSKAEAIAAVQELRIAGVRSIDIGCMQINLMYHPDAFASLDEAFDPPANTTYGARFLSALYQQTGNWPQAAAAYHSQTPDIGQGYESRVMALWPLASQYPDAALAAWRAPAKDTAEYSRLTPAFAAAVRQMHADNARLAAQHSMLPPPAGRGQRRGAGKGGEDYRIYAPEFAASLKRMHADFARLGSSRTTPTPPAAVNRAGRSARTATRS